MGAREGTAGVVFGNFSATFTGVHGLRLERAPLGAAAAPDPERRVRGHRGGAGAATGTVIGREEQLQLVRGAVRNRTMIEFSAECGSGKTALLRAAAPDAYMRVGGTAFEDFLQDLVREFYVYPPGARRLSAEQCTRVLGEVGAVVALDDVAYGPEQIAGVRRALANCAVLVGAGRPVTGRAGRSYPLPGLTEANAVALLARDLGRFIPEAELPAVRALVTAVAGRPLALRQTAALVRYEGRGFSDLSRRVATDPAVLDELAISALGPQAKRLLAVLALLGGALLPPRLVAAMADVEFVAQEFESLLTRGLAERRDDRFGLPVCKAESYRQILYRFFDIGTSVRALAGWIGARDPSGAAAQEAAEAALTLLGLAAERGEWQAIIRLTTVAERVLFLQGHWQACAQVLAQGLAAAHHAEDAAAGAYFAHQQGTLHFLEDRAESARQALTHALDLRTRLGDAAGAAVTRANLAFVTAGPGSGPSAGGPAGAGRRRALIAAAVAAVVLLLGVGIGVGVARGGHGGSSAAGGSPLPGADGGSSSSGSAGASGGSGGTASAPPGSGGPGKPGGTGQGGGKPELQPPLITGAGDYGDVHAGDDADPPVTAFTVTNPNDRPLTIDGITLPGTSAFGIVGDSCPGGDTGPSVLDPGASCSVSVRFAPTGLGTHTGSLTVAYGARTATAELTGKGYATIEVTITPDAQGALNGSVEITADGLTTVCDKDDGVCKADYYDPLSRLSLFARAEQSNWEADWTGVCAPTGAECAPPAGGDISVSVHFKPHLA